MRRQDECVSKLSSFMWKTRMLIAANTGFKFINILRYDYSTNYFFFFVLTFVIFSNPGGM